MARQCLNICHSAYTRPGIVDPGKKVQNSLPRFSIPMLMTVRGIPKSGTTCTSGKLRTAKEACRAIANGLTQPSGCVIQQIIMCTEVVSAKGHVSIRISSCLISDQVRTRRALRARNTARSFVSLDDAISCIQLLYSAHRWNAKDHLTGEELTITR